MSREHAVFPSFYCGPVPYYAAMLKYESVVLEANEHFIKQTPRNRMTIDSPNGAVTLTLPVRKTTSKMRMGDLKINNDNGELKKHVQALQSTYGQSPFFDFYDYLFLPVFKNPPELLLDFNLELHHIILRCLNHEQEFTFTKEFNPITCDADFRIKFNVKQRNYNEPQSPYRQVFAGKNGFLKNLSILDLIFNLGPEARSYLV